MAYLLLETGDKIYLEDLTGFVLLETGFVSPGRIADVIQEDRFHDVIQEDRFHDVVGGE